MIRRFTGIGILLVCGLIHPALWAQNANSSIQGTVADAQGAVVPGASISLTNVGTSQVLHTTSKNDGFFNFTNLSPADYKISATATGFAQWGGRHHAARLATGRGEPQACRRQCGDAGRGPRQHTGH